ncbi:MAG: hypothetical protein HY271_00905, partial [Deltaproteobacteria bacterium]|nr:hypothetical protein [Deltaproteobacteria bacterium]
MSIAPGIESWSGYVAKVGVTRRTGGEKVERLVEHFTQLHEVVPYLQANFLFGLGHSLSDISSARAPPAPLPRPFAAAQSSEIERIVVNLPYPLICALVGFVVGWIPMFFHGPIPEKFNLFGIRGAIAVWTWYA